MAEEYPARRLMGRYKAIPTTEEDLERAQSIALAALVFLAEDESRLSRFLALTGIDIEQLRAGADTPQTLTAVLDHVMGDESLLLVFSASKAVPAEAIAPARALLAGTAGA
jgi:hypothetical protein